MSRRTATHDTFGSLDESDSLFGGDEEGHEMSLNDVARADVRHHSHHSTATASRVSSRPQTLVEKARNRGWTLRPGHLSKPLSPEMQLEDQHVLQDLSNLMVEQLSKMYAHCEVVLHKQQARHSSDLSLMLRKVDKDLKDTYRSVRETFVNLTRQVMALLREVEGGRNEVASIQEKFNAAINMAEVRAQYVEELEAVLDGKNPGTSDALRKLTDQLVAAKKTLDEAVAEHEEREQTLSDEILRLRAQLSRLEAERSVCDGPTPPMLPEMAASWTRRMSPRSDETTPLPGTGDEFRATGSTSPPFGTSSPRLIEASSRCASRSSGVRTPGVDVVGSALRRSDDSRAVSRSKAVRSPGERPPQHRSPVLAARAAAREARKENLYNDEMKRQKREKELETRVKQLEERVTSQHRLIQLASHALQLLRDVFNELRNHWRVRLEPQEPEPVGPKMGMLSPPGSRSSGHLSDEDKQARKAAQMFDRIVKLFYEGTRKMGNFQELFDKMAEEAERPLDIEGAEDASKKDEGEFALPERMPLDPGQVIFGAPKSRERRMGTAFGLMPEAQTPTPHQAEPTQLERPESTPPALGGSSARTRRAGNTFSPMPEEGDAEASSFQAPAENEQLAPLPREQLIPGLRAPEPAAAAAPNPFGLLQPKKGPLGANLAGPGATMRLQAPASGRRLLPTPREELLGGDMAANLPRPTTQYDELAGDGPL